MAELAVRSLVQLLINEAGFLQDVEGEIRCLKEELKRMQFFLKDAAEMRSKEERVRYWISEIRDVALDAEDVIEMFIVKAENKRSRWLRRMLLYGVCHNFQVGKVIESIWKRLAAIDKSRERYGIIQDLGGRMDSTSRSEDPKLRRRQRNEDVVGLEEDVKLLLRKVILEEREGLSIAAIVGMAGIGKSTLARKVYNDAAVADRFDFRGWVVVSTQFRPREIIKELILQVLKPSEDKLKALEIIKDFELPTLQQILHQRLQGRPYFIVVDDMWEVTHWESLADAFPDEDKARLLITSRNWDIKEHTQHVHEMKILDMDKSRQLLLNTVFFGGTDNKWPKHLEHIGREILKKCNGIPSAIKEVGSLLRAQRQSERGWEKVLKTMDSMPGSREVGVAAALELSYHKLPAVLKLCFLCLGFFKEGATIRAEKLVQIWIAGGMLTQGEIENETMEEIARSYLDKLISQNMIQVKGMTKDDQVKNCHINDNLHRLSITKAKEEIRFEILRKEGNCRPSCKARHRAIYCSRESFYANSMNQENLYADSMNQENYLRSLFFHGDGDLNGSPRYWKSFKLLRVLDFEDFGLKKLPDRIGELTRLRYLGLRNNHIQELPCSLSLLKNLEVLDISLNFMVEVPNVLWEIDSLRHLYMSDIICKKPLKIDALKNLQTLTYISVDNWTYELLGLQMMTSLHKLGIEELDGYSDVSKLFTSLAKLENLDCLNLRGFRFRSMPSLEKLGILHRLTQLKLDGLLTKLPSPYNFPPNLSYLTLVNTSLGEDPMPVLKKLTMLLYIKLRNAYTGDKMIISHDGFPKLQVLCIGELWHLRNVQVGKGAMSMLKQLEINNCPYLDSLPEELGLMTNLQELKMVTTPTIASRLRDSHILSNIPSLDIQS